MAPSSDGAQKPFLRKRLCGFPERSPYAQFDLKGKFQEYAAAYSKARKGARHSWTETLRVQPLVFLVVLLLSVVLPIVSFSFSMVAIPVLLLTFEAAIGSIFLMRAPLLLHLIGLPAMLMTFPIVWLSDTGLYGPAAALVAVVHHTAYLQLSPCPLLSLLAGGAEVAAVFFPLLFVDGPVSSAWALTVLVDASALMLVMMVARPACHLSTEWIDPDIKASIARQVADAADEAADLTIPDRSTLYTKLQIIYASVTEPHMRHALREAMKAASGHQAMVAPSKLKGESRDTLRFIDEHAGLASGVFSFHTPSLTAQATSRSMTRRIIRHSLRDSYRDICRGVDQTMGNWDFDVFALHRRFPRYLLVGTACSIMGYHGVIGDLNLDQEKLNNLLLAIEAGYYDNEYHSALHAADVMQVIHWILVCGGFDKHLSSLEIFALLFAAAIHDYGHIGVNNSFIASCDGPLSRRYSDQSTLEAFALACVAEIMMDGEYAIMEDPAVRREVQALVIPLVISTDMGRHNKELATVKERLGAGAFTPPITDAEDRLLLMQHIMKTADISNPARPGPIYREWTTRVVTEFLTQGDAERQLTQPVAAMNDRETMVLRQCQHGFIDYVTRPMFTLLASVAPFPEALDIVFDHMDDNKAFWDTMDGEALSASIKTKTSELITVDEVMRRVKKPLETRHTPRLTEKARPARERMKKDAGLWGRQKQREAQRRAQELMDLATNRGLGHLLDDSSEDDHPV